MLTTNQLLSNTLALSARASYCYSLKDLDDCKRARAELRQRRLPLLVLGAGSNVVLPPEYPGLVVRFAAAGWRAQSQADGSVLVDCDAGANWHSLVLWCSRKGYHGIENLAYIPGSVGAAPVQNIGAYGVELGQFVQQVRGFDFASGERFSFANQDCGFAYRDSIFKRRKQLAISGLTLSLSTSFRPHITYQGLAGSYTHARELIARVGRLRRAKLPSVRRTPNVGSFFCNPVVSGERYQLLRTSCPELVAFPASAGHMKLMAAQLLELAGCRGLANAAGSLRMSARHALVLTNVGAADYRQVLDFAELIRERVRLRFGVELSVEPEIIPGALGGGAETVLSR